MQIIVKKTNRLDMLIKNQRLLDLIKNITHALDEMYIKHKDTEKRKGLKKDMSCKY